MIDRDKHPIGWALLMQELDDAHEHLGDLITRMASDPDYGEDDFRVDLGHVYAHLNLAWHHRNIQEEMSDGERDVAVRFPSDLTPV